MHYWFLKIQVNKYRSHKGLTFQNSFCHVYFSFRTTLSFPESFSFLSCRDTFSNSVWLRFPCLLPPESVVNEHWSYFANGTVLSCLLKCLIIGLCIYTYKSSCHWPPDIVEKADFQHRFCLKPSCNTFFYLSCLLHVSLKGLFFHNTYFIFLYYWLKEVYLSKFAFLMYSEKVPWMVVPQKQPCTHTPALIFIANVKERPYNRFA